MTVFGDGAFRNVIDVTCGHKGGALCNLAGVLVGRGRDSRMCAHAQGGQAVRGDSCLQAEQEASRKATLKHLDL